MIIRKNTTHPRFWSFGYYGGTIADNQKVLLLKRQQGQLLTTNSSSSFCVFLRFLRETTTPFPSERNYQKLFRNYFKKFFSCFSTFSHSFGIKIIQAFYGSSRRQQHFFHAEIAEIRRDLKNFILLWEAHVSVREFTESTTAVVRRYHCVETFVPLRWYGCTNAVEFFWYCSTAKGGEEREKTQKARGGQRFF